MTALIASEVPLPFQELPPEDETVLSASARMTACSVADDREARAR